MDLSSVPWRATRHAGVAVHFYASDRATGRALVLIRMEPGCGYPRHRHVGDEHVLVVQGAYADGHGTHGTGELVVHPDGSEHAPVAVRGGPPCVLLALAHEGITLLA
jgi:anti-sigma factor ChrR (cupin superfamily)